MRPSRRFAIFIYVSMLVLSSSPPARASVGWLDPQYGSRGSAALALPVGRNEWAQKLIPGWNGGTIAVTIAVGGGPDAEHSYVQYARVASRTKDGAVDTAFNHGHALAWELGAIGSSYPYVFDASLDPADGSLLVFSGAYQGNAGYVRRIARAGVIDAAYMNAQGAGVQLSSYEHPRMVVLDDGSARICYAHPPTPSTYDPNLWRVAMLALTPGGAPDATFATNGQKEDVVPGMHACTNMARTPEGKIVVVGSAGYVTRGNYAGFNDWLCCGYIARMTTDATLDSSFGNGGLTHLAYGTEQLAVDTDGSMYVGGRTETFTGNRGNADFKAFVQRVYSNGKVATSFGYGGTYKYALSPFDYLTSLDITTNKRLILGISEIQGFTNADNRKPFTLLGMLLRVSGYTARLDPTFGSNGRVQMPGPTVRALTDAQGRLVTASSHLNYHDNTSRRWLQQVILQRRTQ